MPNFDEIINREYTNSAKWDGRKVGWTFDTWQRTYPSLHGEEAIIPMWVADMDFAAPQVVRDALMERLQHPIYGYTITPPSYFESVCNWMKTRQGWHCEPDWILPHAGIVPAFHFAVAGLLEADEKVVIQPPVYYPFSYAAERHQRELLENTLIYKDGAYEIDFADFEAKCADPKAKLFILCHPHNPVGRIWSEAELIKMGDICTKHGVIILSDEIHSDLIMPGQDFVSFGALTQFRDNVIIANAASKTFNLAGLKSSNVIIPNEALRTNYQTYVTNHAAERVNLFGIISTEAAYNHAGPWLDELMVYLKGNLDLFEAFIAEKLPQLKVVPCQGTYLVWVDCTALGLDRDALDDLFIEQARVYPDEGHIFGDAGIGFMRFNLACPRSILEESLHRIEKAINA